MVLFMYYMVTKCVINDISEKLRSIKINNNATNNLFQF